MKRLSRLLIGLASNKSCYEVIASHICQWEDRPASTAQFK